jgi:hypothetical protein
LATKATAYTKDNFMGGGALKRFKENDILILNKKMKKVH